MVEEILENEQTIPIENISMEDVNRAIHFGIMGNIEGKVCGGDWIDWDGSDKACTTCEYYQSWSSDEVFDEHQPVILDYCRREKAAGVLLAKLMFTDGLLFSMLNQDQKLSLEFVGRGIELTIDKVNVTEPKQKYYTLALAASAWYSLTLEALAEKEVVVDRT